MSHTEASRPKTHGLAAEFDDCEQLMEAARMTREAGYKQIDAYTPFPVEGLADVLGNRDDRVPWVVFLGGVFGAVFGFVMQWYITAYEYPLNVGGRPFVSWPSYIPITFECMVFCAAFGAVIGMLAMNGLPRPYHPIFNLERFRLASEDRFFLCIEAGDKLYEKEKTKQFLASLGAKAVTEVDE